MIKLNEIFPVLISILVIILVAVLQKYSKTVAAVTATMPVTIPLALWIVFSSNRGDMLAVESFTRNMLLGISSTLAFVVALWLGARAGLRLPALLLLGYSAWATVLAVLLIIQRMLHR